VAFIRFSPLYLVFGQGMTAMLMNLDRTYVSSLRNIKTNPRSGWKHVKRPDCLAVTEVLRDYRATSLEQYFLVRYLGVAKDTTSILVEQAIEADLTQDVRSPEAEEGRRSELRR